MSEKKVRVRFAPSPTGPLHIGGVRTALYNYLFAKKNNGDFILRIEDTDQTRFVAGAEDYIIKSLEWCGIKIDEGIGADGEYGPYRQSERKHLYKDYADQLISEGKAYYAFDTPEELTAARENAEKNKSNFQYDSKTRSSMRNSIVMSADEVNSNLENGTPYVVRFKMEENIDIKINDLIREEVVFNSSVLDDKIIFKSDGMPTYHLANVVDDYLMKITHVIRGEEWLPSAPLHVELYRALGWENEMPQFAHLPLILKPNGNGKLSKRDGDKGGFPVFPLEWKSDSGDISSGYREKGYLPEGFINMLALLGWNPGNEQEIFSMDELIANFSLERVGKSGSKFDPDKTKWFNEQYIRNLSNDKLYKMFIPILESKAITADKTKVENIIGLVKERITFVDDLWEQSSFFFVAPTEYDAKFVKKRWKENSPSIMQSIANILSEVDDFTSANTEEKVKAFIESEELGMGQVMNAFRLSIVGAGKGPHLFDIIESIGKEESIKRLNSAIENIKK